MTYPKLRTAAGIFAEIKAKDPETELTPQDIQHMINNNKVPVVRVGRKRLVDLDDAIAYLTAGKPRPHRSVMI